MRNLKFGCSLLALIAGSFLGVSEGFAQNAPATADGGATAPGTSGVETVTVTARRVSENLQKVPEAVTAFSQKQLEALGIVSMEDLQAVTPSMMVTNSSSNRDSSKYFIRGLGYTIGGNGPPPGVVTYFADVPTVANGPGILFDLNNIQVLKGPQGTLFGMNTTGGAILMEPRLPSSDFDGYAEISAGDYDLRRFQGAEDIPLVGDELLLRVATDIDARDGFTKEVNTNTYLDNRNYGSYRATLLWKPNNMIENVLIGDYTSSDTNGGGVVLTAVAPNGLSETYFPTALAVLAAQQARGPRAVEYDDPSLYDRWQNYGATDKLSINVADNLVIKNILAFRAYREAYTHEGDGSVLPLFETLPVNADTDGLTTPASQDQLSEELQLQGSWLNDQLTSISGLFYSHVTPAPGDTVDVLEVLGGTPEFDVSHRTELNEAAYTQLNYQFDGSLTGLNVFAGARYTWDSRLQDSATTKGSYPTALVQQKAEFQAPTWTFGANYNIDQGLMVYATVSRGWKSGGFNNVGTPPPYALYAPEVVTEGELGVKSQFDVGAASFLINADIYRGDYSDIQVAQVEFVSGTVVTPIANGATAVTQGVELEGQMALGQFDLAGSYDYSDAHYVNFVSGSSVYNGRQFQYDPKQKVALTPAYTIPMGPGIGDLRLSGTYTYQSREQFHLLAQGAAGPNEVDPTGFQAPYGLLSLRADWQNMLGHPLTLSIFATNVTNKVYAIYHENTYTSLGYDASLYGEPRMFGASLRYEW